MAVSMQSTSSGGTINFSEGDTLTVNGKIVAQGIISPSASHTYADLFNAQDINWTTWRSETTHTYTVPADGILTLSIIRRGFDYYPNITIIINGTQVLNRTDNDSTGYALASLPVKAGDTFTAVISTNHNAGMTFTGTFYPYR